MRTSRSASVGRAAGRRAALRAALVAAKDAAAPALLGAAATVLPVVSGVDAEAISAFCGPVGVWRVLRTSGMVVGGACVAVACAGRKSGRLSVPAGAKPPARDEAGAM